MDLSKVNSIESLFETVVKQLEENNINTPFYKGTLSDQTLKDLDNVIRLNRLNFWTIDSQETNEDNDGKVQRAYISGFIPINLINYYAELLSKLELTVGVYYLDGTSYLYKDGIKKDWDNEDIVVSYKRVEDNLSHYKHIYDYGTEIDSLEGYFENKQVEEVILKNFAELSIIRNNYYDKESLFKLCADVLERLY